MAGRLVVPDWRVVFDRVSRRVSGSISGWVEGAGRFARIRRWWLAGGAGAAALAVGLAWLLWPASAPSPPASRERQYLEFTACLLTDAQGVTGPLAAPVWAGMQDASLATRAKVQFLAVAGPQTPHNAGLFATSLAQGGCRLVFAAGELPVSGVEDAAPHFPLVSFY